MDPRQQALMDQARRNLNTAKRYIRVNRVLSNTSCLIEVETKPTVENLRLIQSALDLVEHANVKIGPELTDCEELSNLIYFAIAQHFSDSQVNVELRYNDHIEVTNNFNHQSKN